MSAFKYFTMMIFISLSLSSSVLAKSCGTKEARVHIKNLKSMLDSRVASFKREMFEIGCSKNPQGFYKKGIKKCTHKMRSIHGQKFQISYLNAKETFINRIVEEGCPKSLIESTMAQDGKE